jgi:hypothetical protein
MLEQLRLLAIEEGKPTRRAPLSSRRKVRDTYGSIQQALLTADAQKSIWRRLNAPTRPRAELLRSVFEGRAIKLEDASPLTFRPEKSV